MTDSATWSKRLETSLKLAALLPLLALGGCGIEQWLFPRPPAQAPPQPLPPSRADAAQVDLNAGLKPLPSQQQVRAAVPFGRTDPFAGYPLASAGTQAAGSTTPPSSSQSPPEGFLLNGVMRSGGRAEALVSYGGATGTLRLGDRGGRTTALLPSGWSLASIHFGGRNPADRPSITLVTSGRPVKVSL